MRHFVDCFDGRRMFTETETYPLSVQRSIPEALVIIPNYCYGFRFYSLADKVEALPSVGGVRFCPTYQRLDESGTYYPGGKLWDLEHVESLALGHPDQYQILYSNMCGNKMTHVVRTRTGNTQEFHAGTDHILP